MDLTQRLALSYYKDIAVINESHKVYLVQHQETRKIYIKKILDIYNRDIYEQLCQEPIVGVPAIQLYAEENNQLIVIEEYISGESLEEKIASASMTKDQILNWTIELCRILYQLHSKKRPIVHRDIKPSNVIITSQGYPVLLDFNAAKYYRNADKEDTILLGTQGYAAPEQYGFGSSSPQTDIYSMGVLLREMLTSIDSQSYRLNQIIDCCTQMKPSERYKSIMDLRSDLVRYIDPQASDEKSISNHSIIPPGFRSGKLWKMVLATVGYICTFWSSLSLKIEGVTGYRLWLERSFVLILMLYVILTTSNYMNVQRIIPRVLRQNIWLRCIGVVLLNVIGFVFLLTVITIIEVIYFPAQ